MMQVQSNGIISFGKPKYVSNWKMISFENSLINSYSKEFENY